MSWRDNLRPAMFRNAGFESSNNGLRHGRRGAHHEYPGRDKGWVDDLGLKDAAFSMDGYVIGEDWIAKRDALEAALLQPGAGELIHPTRGRLLVVPDVQSPFSVRESSRKQRMARFTMNFIHAADTAQAPTASAAIEQRTQTAAATLRETALTVAKAAVNTGGPVFVGEEYETALGEAAQKIDAQRSVMRRSAVPASAQDIALSANDPLSALTDQIADVMTVSASGVRVLDTPSLVLSAARGLLTLFERPTPIASTGIAARRIAANREAVRFTVRMATLGYLAQASVAGDFESDADAIAAMRAFDIDVEQEIRGEADKPDGGARVLVRALSDLRSITREAMLANAANLIPIARIDPGESLPALALAWRITGGIDIEADLIARNRIAHPLWCPATGISVRAGGGVNV